MRLFRAEAEGGASGAHEEHSHPTWKFYVLIGVILTVITAAEVAVFYIPALRPVLIPLLLVLSGTKFALVVMFFMHLKFDNPIFGRLFVGGIVLAAGVYIAALAAFEFWA